MRVDNGMAHSRDLSSSSSLILEWSSAAHTGQTHRRQPAARAPGDLKSLTHVLKARFPCLAVGREPSSYPGRGSYRIKGKTAAVTAANLGKRERDDQPSPEADINWCDLSSGAWERERRGYQQSCHKSLLDFQGCGPAPRKMQSWKQKLGHVGRPSLAGPTALRGQAAKRITPRDSKHG